MEIPGGSGESPYRVGALLRDVTPAGGDQELTPTWVTDNLKRLKLDRVVEMIEAPDYVDVRSIAATADRSGPPAPRVANALAALWCTARKLRSGTRFVSSSTTNRSRSAAECPPSRCSRCASSDRSR